MAKTKGKTKSETAKGAPVLASYKGMTSDDIRRALAKKTKKAELIAMHKTVFETAPPAGATNRMIGERVAYELQRALKYGNREPKTVAKRREAIEAEFQALAESAPAPAKAEIKKADKAPAKAAAKRPEAPRDSRLPEPGTILERMYGERLVRVRINEGRSVDLLDSETGEVEANFRTISGAAKVVCRCEVSGFAFFKLNTKEA